MHETFMVVENRAIMINGYRMRPSQIAFNVVAQLLFLKRYWSHAYRNTLRHTDTHRDAHRHRGMHSHGGTHSKTPDLNKA